MKRTLLIISSLFFLNFLVAQPFIPMLNEHHQWSHDNIASLGGFNIVSSDLYLDGTVEYNGITYQLIRDTLFGWTCLVVREEDGVIFYYDENENIEFPVIDFNLEIGDTFSLPNFELYQCSFQNILTYVVRTVTNVEYLTIAGAERKVITMDFGEKWYEGIGSTLGVVPYAGIDYDIRLVCFTSDGETTFFNGATSCDNTNLSIADNLQNQIVLAPNPVQNVSILQLPSELNIDTVRVYDIAGKMISEESVTKNYLTIDAMDYASGVYFCQALSDNEVIKTDRFIVK